MTAVKYLQYTHEIPQALLVIIPHNDRNKECGINNLHGETLPLHKFITVELDKQLKSYNPNGHRTIIGHSFSASFALYSYLKKIDFYSAVIANTPLDHFEELVVEIEKNEKADQSSHNAVPIVATPLLLTGIFADFSSRYIKIAEVNAEYKLVTTPKSIKDEISRVEHVSIIGSYKYLPEIPDINGLASRYLSSGMNEYGIAKYEMGVKYFPKYFEFHLSLYELYLPKDKTKAINHLNTAISLLKILENDLPEQKEILNELNEKKIIDSMVFCKMVTKVIILSSLNYKINFITLIININLG